MTKHKARKNGQDPYLEREKLKYEHPIPSREFILEVIRKSGRPLSRRDLGEMLALEDAEQLEGLRRRLRAMERDGQLIQNRRRAYVIVDNEELIRGRIVGQKDGSGFLEPDAGGERIYLAPKEMRSLLHGDRAVVRVVGLDAQNRPQGDLVEVLKRHNKHIVGRFYLESGIGFVVPENKRIHHDVIVPSEEQVSAAHGQLVVAEIVRQPSLRRQPIGRVVEVIGQHVEAGMEIQVAARVHNIPVEWPGAVLEEAGRFADTVPEASKQGRVDLRDTPLVTIDGPDARDFDDAVFCAPTPKGWRLIVAIADVAEYVKPTSALDREARERGNSVYFPRSVVPMLPEALSNGLCSLNPNVDRLCLCCEITLSADGSVRRSKFFKGVIHSHARLTYDEVAAIVVDGDRKAAKRRADLVPHLRHLYEAYKAMRQARAKRGAIDFETTEAAIVFDDDGRIREIAPAQRNEAHKIIEECMVTANVAAARFLQRHKMPALYRDHERPNQERLEKLHQFLGQVGLQLGGGDAPTPQDYAKLMEKVRGRPDSHLIQTVLLRSMQAAEYRPDNVGHFGLALDEYAHFTSPIRRYPDLMVHRAIRHVLEGGSRQDYAARQDEMVALGEHCSMTERRADEATRDAIMSLKCEFMANKLGEEFEGVISGVTSFGLFVELSGIFVDGLIHITNLANDYFHFDPIGHRLTGERSGTEYKLTDKVTVKVARVDKDERQIDFELVEHHSSGAARRGPGKRRVRTKTTRSPRQRAKQPRRR
ncbi:ribonuclease R [Alkalilimnicola ehrlichii]|uniref:ribonuclease R n=1 Tax=Alkalilimnicola ehrlichii TaxID=351052 RepID=UPI000E2E8A54|nr:ribonuclease R [Alkalilimnicola ehrlichii]RFA30469.1 ribonuclease R [Alkalilimnicola ehrlichii]